MDRWSGVVAHQIELHAAMQQHELVEVHEAGVDGGGVGDREECHGAPCFGHPDQNVLGCELLAEAEFLYLQRPDLLVAEADLEEFPRIVGFVDDQRLIPAPPQRFQGGFPISTEQIAVRALCNSGCRGDGRARRAAGRPGDPPRSAGRPAAGQRARRPSGPCPGRGADT
jgi:hypothetical protein